MEDNFEVLTEPAEEQTPVPETTEKQTPPVKVKRFRFLKGFLTGAFAALAIVALIAGSFARKYALFYDDGIDYWKIYQKLRAMKMVVDNGFLFDIDEEAMTEGIYKGFMSGLNDPYSAYFDADMYDAQKQSTSGTFYGIGVSLTQSAENNLITVLRVFRGSGAEAAGMLPGDILYAVDGDDITKMELESVVARIKGEDGSNVSIKVFRPELRDYVTMDVARGDVVMESAEWRMLDDSIGYLQIVDFNSPAYPQFAEGLADLKSQGMKALILDLRSNTGGLLNAAENVASDLLDGGLVVALRDKYGRGEDNMASEGTEFDGPMVVLVNGYSASASEVLTGALKDRERALVVGTKTFGKGIVQTMQAMGDGSAYKMTIAKYLTPNGTDIHGVGITPDVEIPYERSEDGTDNQLQRAVEEIKKMM